MSSLRVLRVHNAYRDFGGEDAVFRAETHLLRVNGIDVATLTFSNEDIADSRSLKSSIALSVGAVWSTSSRRLVAEATLRHRADVVHFDNTFPLISPSAYSAARDSGAAVVQSLHNYRLLCSNALFYRDGQPCEDCLAKAMPYPGVVHSCYRASRAQTAAVATMTVAHRLRRTWNREVDCYVTPTEFARSKFIVGGLSPDRIVVKPHFVESDSRFEVARTTGCFLYVGRLSAEKGIRTLLRAQRHHGQSMRIAGSGPLNSEVLAAAEKLPKIASLGRISSEDVRTEMLAATALVFPSEVYETFGMSLIEAFAVGLPVIASRTGAMAEIVDEGRTGLLFAPGDELDLADKVRWAADHPDQMMQMGIHARREYESRYTPEQNLRMLVEIYERAVSRFKGLSRQAPVKK